MRATEPQTRAEKMERERRFPGIRFADADDERVAHLDGYGIKVWQVVRALRLADNDRTQLLSAWDWVPAHLVTAVLDYYAAYPTEIDSRLEEEEEPDPQHFPSERRWSNPTPR